MADFQQARKNMVDCQIRPADVTDLGIIGAMGEVPRERFVDEVRKSIAYIDEDIKLAAANPNGPARYLMEPASFARLLQLAQLAPGAIVLDVGCATGYSSAVLSRLCSSIVALESDERLAAIANDILTDLEISNVVVLNGDLEKGYPKEGPYDVIFVGGAVSIIDKPLLNQLKDGGKLVAVVGEGSTAHATLFVRNAADFSSVPHFNCAVQPLPGFDRVAEFEF